MPRSLSYTTPPTIPTSINVCSEEGWSVVEHDIQQAIKEQLSSDLLYYIARLEEVQTKECPLLQKAEPDLYERYQKIIAQAKWYLFPHMGPGHVERLFADHLEFFFAKPWDEVARGLRVIFIAQGDWATRDTVKTRFRNALARSKVHIGENTITVAGLEKQSPTVGNWLRDFRDSVKDNPISPLSLVEYLNTSPNISGRADIRAKVEHLLKLYFELTKSSQTPEGAEEQIMFSNPITGTYHVWENGDARDTGIPLPEKRLKELRTILGVDERGRPLTYAQLIRRTIAQERKELGTLEATNTLSLPPMKKNISSSPLPLTPPSTPLPQPPTPPPPATPALSPTPVRSVRPMPVPPLKPTYRIAKEQMEQHKKWDQLTEKPEEQISATPEVEDVLASTNPIFETALRPKRLSVLPQVPLTTDTNMGNGRLGTTGPMRKTKVITDVLPPQPSVMLSPIEELARLDVTEFRRLSPDPHLAAQKIIDKLTLLEQDSISKKADGIDVYYSSPLHKAYCAIGNASLDQSRPIADLIQEQQAAGVATLRQEEFDAIADLNRQLRF